jgi:hypothetical protein
VFTGGEVAYVVRGLAGLEEEGEPAAGLGVRQDEILGA